MLKGAHPMCVLCVCFCEDLQVLSTSVVTEKCLQQARQEQPARKIIADNQNHYKTNPCLTRHKAQHCDSWIKSLKISHDHRWQRYMVYLHAPFPNIALLLLTTAVVEVFLQVQCLSQTTAFAKDSCSAKCFFSYLSHFPADRKLILFSDQNVSYNPKLRYIVKILHFYSNQPLFNCVVFISKWLSLKNSHMWQVTL